MKERPNKSIPPESHKDKLKRLIIYILISIPMTFLLIKVIEYKLKAVFWIYLITMGITALISRWHSGSKTKTKVVQIADHITIVGGITLFLWYAVDYFLYR